MVVIGCALGGLSLSQIRGLFGAASQLLAVCTWLENVGKNHRMFNFPMAFMPMATETSLIMAIIRKLGMIGSGTAAWGDWFQMICALVKAALAIVPVVEAAGAPGKQKRRGARACSRNRTLNPVGSPQKGSHPSERHTI